MSLIIIPFNYTLYSSNLIFLFVAHFIQFIMFIFQLFIIKNSIFFLNLPSKINNIILDYQMLINFIISLKKIY